MLARSATWQPENQTFRNNLALTQLCAWQLERANDGLAEVLVMDPAFALTRAELLVDFVEIWAVSIKPRR